MKPSIAILTDFGIQDTYVGVMKSVIVDILPEVQLIDLTHAIPPGDVRTGAFEAWRAAPYLPPGCVLLGVVDPGVGTVRQPLALDLGTIKAVGPDNGLFSYLLYERELLGAARLESPEYRLPEPRATFHGRDIFAPAAAHLAGGLALSMLGPEVSDLERLEPPRLEADAGGSIQGEILLRDRFGNLVTSIGRISTEAGELQLRDWTGRGLQCRMDPRKCRLQLPDGSRLRLGRTFGDVPVGAALTYTGSMDLLEISINQGDAAATLKLKPGDRVLFNEEG